MGFTTPCFIRKNTPELRKELEYLGYSHGKPEYYADDDDNKYDFIMCHNGRFFLLSQENHVIRNGHPLKKHGSIDCGTNEELFLALARKRDDTSADQYWVFDKDFLPNYKKGDFTIGYSNRCSCYCHVATAQELIQHFK
jgi:hypothetical protein